jgi:hypothetical protein
MAVDRIYIRRVYIYAYRKITEEVHSFRYLGYSKLTYEMNMAMQENIQKYNKLNRVIKR